MRKVTKQKVLKGINVINPGIPKEEDAEIEVVIDNSIIKMHGKQAWEVVNKRNMAVSMLNMARKAKLVEDVDVDDIVVPYALKNAREIWSILEHRV